MSAESDACSTQSLHRLHLKEERESEKRGDEREAVAARVAANEHDPERARRFYRREHNALHVVSESASDEPTSNER